MTTARHASQRTWAVVAAAALLALLVMPIVTAGAAPGTGGPEARASASVKKKLKKLNQRIEALEQEQQGPRPPSGNAGGDLAGSYPNPLIAGGSVTSATVANDSLTGVDVEESRLDLADVSHAVVDVGAGATPPASLGEGRGATGVVRNSLGNYTVSFDRPVPQSECSATANFTVFGTVGTGPGEVALEHSSAATAIRVKTFSSTGAAVDHDFTLIVAC